MGHATRCIPIIKALIKAGFTPILASDGNALLLLQKEFPNLKSYTLPSYNIRYTKNSNYLKFKLLLSVPSVFLAVKKEKEIVNQIIKKENITGIISDNRFGVHSKKIPSVYITHQLNVISGFTTKITSKIHQKIISKFDECWIPDVKNEMSLSGELSNVETSKFNIKYIGVLSRFKSENIEKKYDVLVLLSGVEPQRTLLENKLLFELKNFKGNVLFIRGIFTVSEEIKTSKNIKIVDHLLSKDLNKAINESDLVLTRSGYSTIMDLAVLGKKAFFIPTPGQNEQEYLADQLLLKKIAPFAKQDTFKIKYLKKVNKFKGFLNYKTDFDLNFFNTFKCK